MQKTGNWYKMAGIAAMILLAGCANKTTTINQQNNVGVAQQRGGIPVDKRSDAELLALLPDETLSQKEFPKAYLASMVRVCVSQNAVKNPANPIAMADKGDPFCSCLAQKRVKTFTLDEYMQGEKARWDAKAEPELAHKNNTILSQCAKTVLQ